MAMEQWSPFRDMLSLRDAMDRLFQSSFVSPRGLISGQLATTNGMALDVTEHENGYDIEASMPGVNPDDVQITIQGNTLMIRGEVSKAATTPPQGQSEQAHDEHGQHQRHAQALARERFYGTYLRQVTLPTMVNADQAKASFKNGILYLTLPKAEEARPRQIPISQTQDVHHIVTPAEQRQQQAPPTH